MRNDSSVVSLTMHHLRLMISSSSFKMLLSVRPYRIGAIDIEYLGKWSTCERLQHDVQHLGRLAYVRFTLIASVKRVMSHNCSFWLFLQGD